MSEEYHNKINNWKQSKWHKEWHTYLGSVRVIMPDTSVRYGKVVAHHIEQHPAMYIKLNDGTHLWTHPAFVCPPALVFQVG